MFKPIFHLNIMPSQGGNDDNEIHYAKCNQENFISGLCNNPTCVDVVAQLNPKLWDNNWLNCNPDALHLILPRLKTFKKRDWSVLCENPNPNVLRVLEKNMDKVSWMALLQNPSAIPLFEKYISQKKYNDKTKIEWVMMSWNSNPNIGELLEKHLKVVNWFIVETSLRDIAFLERHQDKLNWKNVSSNEHAVPLLEKNLDKVCWRVLSGNKNAVHLLEANMDKVDAEALSGNPNAVHLIERILKLEHGDQMIDWRHLSGNPNAVHLLEANPDKIDWYFLSSNPNAMRLIRANLDKISLKKLSTNPHPEAILIIKQLLLSNEKTYATQIAWLELGNNPNALLLFDLNTEAMRAKCRPFAHDLAAHVFHPARLMRLCETYGLDLAEYMELIGD